MSIFTNSFFSIAGQVERIKNVGATLNAAFNPFAITKGVTANTGHKTADKVLSNIASHPYVAASIVAGGISAVTNPTAAAAVTKTLIPKSLIGKGALGVGGLIGTGLAIKSPATATQAVLSTPSSLINVGYNAGNLIENPSFANVGKIYKENPFVAGALTAVAAATAIGGAGLAANTYATYANTKATNKSATEQITSYFPTPNDTTGDYKDQIKIIDANTKSQIAVIDAQTAQYRELSEINTAATPPTTTLTAPKKATKKKKKAKKKPKKKAKKKPKKKAKKKKKTIKRRKTRK